MHSKVADVSLVIVIANQIAKQARAHKQDNICVVSGSF